MRLHPQSVYIPHYILTLQNNVRVCCLGLFSRLKSLYFSEVFKLFTAYHQKTTTLRRLASQNSEALSALHMKTEFVLHREESVL
jgi:plasmid replication initiation protein